jgi:hypothetical protein
VLVVAVGQSPAGAEEDVQFVDFAFTYEEQPHDCRLQGSSSVTYDDGADTSFLRFHTGPFSNEGPCIDLVRGVRHTVTWVMVDGTRGRVVSNTGGSGVHLVTGDTDVEGRVVEMDVVHEITYACDDTTFCSTSWTTSAK